MKKILITLTVVVVLVVTYWLISPLWIVKQVNEPLPTDKTSIQTSTAVGALQNPALLSGTFVNGVHNVSGTTRVLKINNQKIIRFDNFKTLNGPDLYIYLATDNSAKDFVSLGAIKGTEGNINYSIPNGTDLNKYSHVLIWCKTFSVLFGSAELR